MSHGGAFRRFTGLRTHRSNYIVGDPTYPGIPCLHLKHNKGTGARCWRDSKTHACLECLDEIDQRKFGLDLSRFSDEVKSRALLFWSQVDITGFDDCWQWNDPIERKQLYFFWKRREIRNRFQWHPIVVSMWLCWGDTGRLGSESVCGNRRCVNPMHNLPIGHIPSIRPADYDDDWLRIELNTLKEQVASFQQGLNKSLSKKPMIKLPGFSQVEMDSMDDLSEFMPYQNALDAMRQSLNDGTHSMIVK